MNGYDERGLLPEPDVIVGRAKGWSEDTVLKWNDSRPGRGARTDMDPKAVKAKEKRLTLRQRTTEEQRADAARRKAVAAAKGATRPATTVTATNS